MNADHNEKAAAPAYTIGAHSTDTCKFIYDPAGELVATVRAPDDNAAGIEFARSHAERIVAALNWPGHDFVRSAGDAELCGAPGCGHYASNREVHRRR